MANLNIRNVPEELAKAVRVRAAELGLGVNEACIGFLEDALNLVSAPVVPMDLDDGDAEAMAGAFAKVSAQKKSRAVNGGGGTPRTPEELGGNTPVPLGVNEIFPKGGLAVGHGGDNRMSGKKIADDLGGVVAQEKPDMAKLRAICAGKLTDPVVPIIHEREPGEVVMCSWFEFDGESGETMCCGLDAHGPKVKHGAWYKR